MPRELKEIVGKNKLRDLVICLEYISGKMPSEIIATRNLGLTIRRVEQIVFANASFVNPRIAWPKSRRVHLRQWLIEKKLSGVDQFSSKDVVEQLNSLRDEIEGDKPLVDQSQHTHYTIQNLAKEIANGDTRRLEEHAPEALSQPGFVLGESLRRDSLEEASGNHGSASGQAEGNGKVL